MKRLIDIECLDCGHKQFDVWVDGHNYPACSGAVAPAEVGMPMEVCFGQTTRLWQTKAGAAHSDEIPGGVLIHNAICHANGAPRRFYSKSAIKRAADKAGYSNIVTHVVDPTTGSDKSPHTIRWDATPAYMVSPEAEAERVRQWHAHEASLT